MNPWWRRLWRYTRPHYRGLAAVGGWMLLGVGLDLLKPWPLKLLVDHAVTGRALPRGAGWLTALPGAAAAGGLIVWLAAGTLLLFVAAQLVRLGYNVTQTRVGNRLVFQLAADLFDHLQRLSLRYHGQQTAGDLVRRVTGSTGCVRDLALYVVLPALGSLVSLVTMVVVTWRLHPALALLVLLTAVPMALIIRRAARPMGERSYQKQVLEGELLALAEQTLAALPVVQAFGRERYEYRRYRRLSRRTFRASMRETAAQIWFKISTSIVPALGSTCALAVGGWFVIQGQLSVGSLLVVLAYVSALYAPLETLAYLSTSWASAAAGARRVFEVLDVDDRVRELPNARPVAARPRGERGHVRLEHVSFGYAPDRPVLQEVSLEARPGETVALVGPTGAGKSTLVSLLPRFYDPWQGRVLFDGDDVRELQLASLRGQIGIVLQEPFLLPLTVAENIAYSRPGASRAAVEAAAVAARADEFIRRLPRGYDTVIGERGATLSGGERQRLAIARAFLKDAPVLILDEPTAALDAQTEAALLAALADLMKSRTTIIIAHRLSTVQRADRIAVLDAGRIVEYGRPAELLAAGGLYRRLHDLQFGSTTPLGGVRP